MADLKAVKPMVSSNVTSEFVRLVGWFSRCSFFSFFLGIFLPSAFWSCILSWKLENAGGDSDFSTPLGARLTRKLGAQLVAFFRTA